MKTIVFIFAAAIALSCASCKKCYTCTDYPSAGTNTEVCKGDPLYDFINKGAITNNQGQQVDCD